MEVAREAYARAATRHLDLAELPRAEPLWVPAGLMAVLLTLISALGAFGGEVVDSGWSSTAGSSASSPASRTQQFRSATLRPVASATLRPTPTAGGVGRVRLVAFDPDADNTHIQQVQHGSASVKSIVVSENGQRRGYRIAQDDELLQGFEQPFGAEELPPGDDYETPNFDNPGFDDPGFDDPGYDEPMIEEPRLDDLAPLEEEDPFERDDQRAQPSPGDRDNDNEDDDLFNGGSRGYENETQPENQSSAEYDRVMKNCDEELAELKARTISQIDLSIAPTGDAGNDYPFECSIDDGTPFVARSWPEVCYMWKASALCHKPLYFEDVQLERYGHSWGPAIQPLVSGVHFFTRIPVLPYCMGITAPNECIYTLGHYRPGSCAPYMIPAVPFTWRAAAMQGAAATGAAFAIP